MFRIWIQEKHQRKTHGIRHGMVFEMWNSLCLMLALACFGSQHYARMLTMPTYSIIWYCTIAIMPLHFAGQITKSYQNCSFQSWRCLLLPGSNHGKRRGLDHRRSRCAERQMLKKGQNCTMHFACQMFGKQMDHSLCCRRRVQS